MTRKNPKSLGEKGQAITIGELAKHGIVTALPMSDNLAFDLILIYDNKLYKAQVKSSNRTSANTKGSISFGLTTSNWYKGTTTKYDENDCDVMLLCDFDKVYLLDPQDFVNRSSFNIRREAPRNNQKNCINLADDFQLSEKRIQEVLL